MLRIFGLSIAIVGTLAGSELAAQPAPDASAQATPAVRQACRADGDRLCVGIPREPRAMTRCILQHWSELGPPCKAAIVARRNAMRAYPDRTQPPPAPPR